MYDTMAAQIQLIYGEFIDPQNEADNLHYLTMIMYWVYAITYMVVIFMLLLNFFLAIVVDAFMEVKKDEELNVTEKDFVSDLFDAIASRYVFARNRWPVPREILLKLQKKLSTGETKQMWEIMEEREEELMSLGQDYQRHLKKIEPEEIREMFPTTFKEDYQLANFILYYFEKCEFLMSAKQEATMATRSEKFEMAINEMEEVNSESGSRESKKN